MTTNEHWDSFMAELDWAVDGSSAVVGILESPGSWSPTKEVAAIFPKLSKLLSTASTSSVFLSDASHVLFSWETAAGTRSWLCRSPQAIGDLEVCAPHRALLEVFGGIVERASEPSNSWLLNTNASLTVSEAREDATFLSDYE